jgi:RimJ/RimL family protein N-acetyltransferase
MSDSDSKTAAIALNARRYELKNGCQLVIRQVEPQDATALLDYIERISGESDFLSFGPDEFECSQSEEVEFIQRCRAADNELFILGAIHGEIVGVLNFAGGKRRRMRHSGELGMSVLKNCWSLGIGSLLLDTLIDWARKSTVVTKLNLRVRTDNERAVSLYRHKGFAIEGTVRKDFLINGIYFDHYWMGLDLQPPR